MPGDREFRFTDLVVSLSTDQSYFTRTKHISHSYVHSLVALIYM